MLRGSTSAHDHVDDARKDEHAEPADRGEVGELQEPILSPKHTADLINVLDQKLARSARVSQKAGQMPGIFRLVELCEEPEEQRLGDLVDL